MFDQKRDAEGRFSSGNQGTADRKPATVLDKVRHVLEQQLDRLIAKPGDVSPSELASIAKTLLSVIEKQEPTTMAAKERDECDALIEAMTPEERTRLTLLFDHCDAIKNAVRQRLDLPVVPPLSKEDPLEYLLALIDQRDEQFVQLVRQLVSDHDLEEMFEADAKEMGRSVAFQLRRFFKRNQLEAVFDQIVERTLSGSHQWGPAERDARKAMSQGSGQ